MPLNKETKKKISIYLFKSKAVLTEINGNLLSSEILKISVRLEKQSFSNSWKSPSFP